MNTPYRNSKCNVQLMSKVSSRREKEYQYTRKRLENEELQLFEDRHIENWTKWEMICSSIRWL